MIAPVADIPDLPLTDALALVRGAFDADAITRRAIDSTQVVEYYRQSERAYRMFHSSAGALHIGLSAPGSTGEDVGHERHVQLFAELVEQLDAQRAIEFGCGLAYNVRTLAAAMPRRSFTGVDLSPHHIKSAHKLAGSLDNLQLVEGNYQQLDLADASFDAVLAIETLCQTGEQRLALAEAQRLLRPGGAMMVIDCFRNRPLDEMSDEVREAVLLVEKTAAVDAFAVIDEWKDMAADVGFEVAECTDRSAETARDLARLYRLARRFFKMSLAVKMIRRAMPTLAIENAVCGLLMPHTVGCGAHGYYTITLQKPAE